MNQDSSYSSNNDDTVTVDEVVGASTGFWGLQTVPSQQTNFTAHRRPTRLDLFENNQKLDIRAHQRTYEGAYTRTAIGSLAFSIMIIKLFSKEFLPIGTIYTLYGMVVFIIGH
ncbi:hypothetical protein PSN45_000996 [Yamadazyma tenuis]|uniref:uncharacterized protein n=1 Tax=Candida tenuis TaxID=2315449 RepID=UPI0027A2A2EC|nr:hypothetical protein PSN45_000996 [Yamadazyma tenuis]